MTTILVTRFCQNAALAFPLQLRAVEKTLLTRAALENNMGLRSASMSTTPVSSERPSVDSSNLRRIKDLPGPKAYPIVGSMFSLRAAFTDIVPMFTARAKQYYPMYREKILGQNIVVLSGSELIETFFRHEEKYPNRFDMPMWMEYREKSGEAYGVFTGRAEQWHRMRTVVDKPMMRMKDVSAYTEEVNEVVTDFLDRLGKIRDEGRVAPDLEGELFNWSLESIGSILYEHRFGGLSDDRDPEMEEFIRSVHVMLQTSTELFMYPVWLTKIFRNKDYKAHARAWDTLFRIAKKCVDARVTEIAAQRERGEEAQGVLPYLLAQKSLSEKEIYANVTELIFGAVDTTSNTTLWTMYQLSQHPSVQERLSAEVERVLPDGRIPFFRDVQDLPYLRAVVKETLRLYPPTGSLARVISEDMELGGYFLPKKTAVTVPLYAVGRMEQYFEDPLKFNPDRWLKDRKDRPNPYGSLPFGVGVRSCVGRRVAELQLYVLIARLIQRFRIEAAFTDTPLISMRLVLRPDRPLRFRLIDRR